MEKVFKKRNIKIINFILIIFAILIFEFGYCNCGYTVSKLTHVDGGIFHFSICRGVFYIVVLLSVFFVNKSSIVDEIEKSFSNKTKRLVVRIDVVAELLIFIIYTYKFLIKQEYALIQYSIIVMALIIVYLAVEMITDKYFTNIISVFLIGIIFCITTTTYHIFDEKKHFMSAYNLSYGNFDLYNPIVDTQFMEEVPRGTHYTLFNSFFENKYEFKEGELPKEYTVDSTPAGYNPILYIPTTLGILTGRILQGSVADIFLMGRLFNLLAYVGLIILTIRILPYKKNTFFVLMSMPLLLCYSATYSPDGIGMGLISIFIAFCLKLREKKENIKYTDLIFLAGMYCLVLAFKTMSYAFVGIIALLLPIKTIFRKYNKKLIYIFIGFILGSLLIFSIQPKVILTDDRYEDVSADRQIASVLENPTILIDVAKSHIRNTLLNWSWIKDLNTPLFLAPIAENMFLIMIIVYIYVALKDDSNNFSAKQKCVFITAFALVYGFISGVFYLACTPVGAAMVIGFQVRYMFPILSCLMLVLSNNTLKSKDENFLIKLTFIQIIFIASGVMGSIIK